MLLAVVFLVVLVYWFHVGCWQLPSRFDWFKHNGMQRPRAVKQTKCGSCWAIATCTALGARLSKEHGPEYALDNRAVEDIMVNAHGSRGCLGGSLASAYRYACTTGLVTHRGRVRIRSAANIAHTDRCEIKHAIAARGPVAAHMMEYPSLRKVTSDTVAWQPQPSELPINGHAVVLFGWDDLAGGWLVQNSWGVGWGNQGVGLVKYGAARIDSLHVLDCRL